MTAKGTLIATLAAGYLATMAPIANAAEEPAPAPKADKAGCKGKEGCKGHDGKKKGDKAGCKGAGGCKGAEGSKDKDKKEAPAPTK
ncbi:MAG TPA: hypothetical protein VGF45_10010 [Polyangia bacterium]